MVQPPAVLVGGGGMGGGGRVPSVVVERHVMAELAVWGREQVSLGMK